MSDEELNKLGLDPEAVAEVRRRLKYEARGKAWKLEVIEGPEGKELRGIFEGDEEELGWTFGEKQEDGDEVEAEEEEDEGSREEFRDEL